MPPGVYLRPTLEERLRKYTDRHGPTPPHRPEFGQCWEWLKGINRDGYGRVKAESGMILTHRLALEIASGEPVPDGFRALHTCDNRRCLRNDEAGFYEVNGVIRPRWGHLWLGTNADNMADAVAKGRVSNGEQHSAVIRELHRRGRKNGAVTHPESVVRGERIASAKLSAIAVREIMERLATGSVTQRSLAIEYGVSEAAISMLAHGKTWKHLS